MLGVWICMFLEAGCRGTHVTRPPSKNFHCSARSGHTDFFYLRPICRAGAKRGVHLSPRTRPPGVHPLLIAASLTSSLRTPPKTGEATPQLVNVKSIEVGAPRRVLGYQISPPTHTHTSSALLQGENITSARIWGGISARRQGAGRREAEAGIHCPQRMPCNKQPSGEAWSYRPWLVVNLTFFYYIYILYIHQH